MQAVSVEYDGGNPGELHSGNKKNRKRSAKNRKKEKTNAIKNPTSEGLTSVSGAVCQRERLSRGAGGTAIREVCEGVRCAGGDWAKNFVENA